MSKTKKNILIVASLCVLFYLSFAYELKSSFLCNIFNPEYYSDTEVVFKLLFSVAVVAVVFLFALLMQSKYFRDSKLLNFLYTEKAFLIFMLVAGVVVSVLIPLYQIPDEPTHISMIYEELGLDAGVSTYFYQYGQPLGLIFDNTAKLDLTTYFTNNVHLSMPAFISTISIGIIKHLPQAIGLLICSLLNCPIIVAAFVCELLAVIFSSFVCYFALKLMPSRKLLFASIMALPLCIQQNGSFSYDAVLVPVCFLLFAFILNIKFVKSKFTTKDILIIILLSFIIALIKIPYILIGALIFIIPSQKFSFKIFKWELNQINWKKYKKVILPVFIIILVTAACCILILSRGSFFSNLLLVSIINLPHTIKLIAKFILLDICKIWDSYLWDFCWLNIAPSIYYLLFIIVTLFIFNFIKAKKESKHNFKLWEHIYIFIIFAACFYIITISMVEHTFTIQNIDASTFTIDEFSKQYLIIQRVLGLQGRYFIPILPLLCFSFSSRSLCNLFSKVNYKLYSPIYFSVICIYIVVVMLTRFWI